MFLFKEAHGLKIRGTGGIDVFPKITCRGLYCCKNSNSLFLGFTRFLVKRLGCFIQFYASMFWFPILSNELRHSGLEEVERLHPALRVGDGDRQETDGPETSEELDGTSIADGNHFRKRRGRLRCTGGWKVILKSFWKYMMSF